MTYSSDKVVELGTIVSIPLKSTHKNAVVLESVDKPIFETFDIYSTSHLYYTQQQLELSSFISQYYFSSIGEALSLFTPYSRENRAEETIDKEISSPPTLSQIQLEAYKQIMSRDRSLLFGVTGSGKTEIFISMMIEMQKEGKSSIFLMPEISLTPQMEKRLRVYFGDRLAIWHSKLSKKKRLQITEDIYNGKIDIIAGARSALFVPLKNLGLIVVDEEHDDSYKSMTKPRYHARDVALLIGAKLEAKVVLASATPSASSYFKYDTIKLDRPYIETKKIYHFLTGGSLTTDIIDIVQENYKRGEQTLMFLPTRGNFKYLYCENCGKTHLCPYCSVGMALHRYNRHLKCHYCGFTERIVEKCIECGHHPLKSERMGTVEAKEMIEAQIPSISIEQFDKDSITTAKKLKEALKRFEDQESHLLLGTQMLSKGHDYANITLSVILGLDYILGLADYRARERAMSLLLQIAGRSGRAKEATVVVQTNNKESFTPYLDDYSKFLDEELEFRRGIYPPFVSLARILISHKDHAKAMNLCYDTVDKLRKFSEIEIVGDGKAPIEKIANKYRYHVLLRSKDRGTLIQVLHSINSRAIEIDMDPVEFS
ncbi:Helicase PriA essential for oriC/DnaA-independent DNA replication [hydrothermal vent metagenome]|uniref:DNA 3'-5' helicase n=1 Tax=hydrothermal vent metagenome TaxID=652676 RepID=A0A1W1BA46_9ZZZZ